ncbi:MAG TPA: T9SS type A sorting domain-containing protein [Bacteroidota bacterium]|nr:T9SS type A sorting domain-containing protein [Bacteroidota bacterium]
MFQKLYGSSGAGQDVGFAGLQTRDGGYLFAGSTNGFGSGQTDGYLIKTNTRGDTMWSRTFGASNYEHLVSVQQTADGGYIATGPTQSFGVGGFDYYLVRVDSLGNHLWSRTYGGTLPDEPARVIQTRDGGYLIGGLTSSFGAGGTDLYFVKTNVSGDTIWARAFGSITSETVSALIETRDGGYVAAGRVYDAQTFDNDMYIIKTTSNGGTSWIQTIGGSEVSERALDDACAIRQIQDGGYIIAGRATFGMDVDVVLIRTDSAGAVMWLRRYGGPAAEFCFDVQQTSDGGYVVAGSTFSNSQLGNLDSYLFKTDANGGLLWSRRYGQSGTDEVHSVVQTTDGGYLLTGYQSFEGTGYRDLYVIKTDGTGTSGCLEDTAGFVSAIASLAVANQFALVHSGCFVEATATAVYSGAHTTTLCTSVSVKENERMPEGFSLQQNYPNPFNPATHIPFTIQVSGFTSLKVYDVLGREVATLVNGNLQAGSYEITFNADGLASGVYLYRLQAGKFVQTRKLVLLH